jgi:hypothetical protein
MPVVDLTQKHWRGAFDAVVPYWTPVVYLVRDKKTGEFLKVGETRAWHGRFPTYKTRGRAESREIEVEVFPFSFRFEDSGSLVFLQDLFRGWLELLGHSLLWDKTYQRHKRLQPAQKLAAQWAGRPLVPRALDKLVQAILLGLAVQAAVDRNAFERREMLHLCLDLLADYLGWDMASPDNKRKPKANKPSTRRPARVPSRPPAGQAQGGKL